MSVRVSQGDGTAAVEAGRAARPPANGVRTRLWLWHGLQVVWFQVSEERARHVAWLPVLFGCGVAAYFAMPHEPGLAAALAPVAAVLFVHAVMPRDGVWSFLAGCLLLVSLGFAAAKVRTELAAAPVLERPVRAAEVRGLIERIEPHAVRGVRLTVHVTSIAGLQPERMPQRVRIRVLAPAPGIGPGDAIRFTATLSPPSAPAIPGGYDFGRRAYFQGIGAVGYALRAPELVAPPAEISLTTKIATWLQSVRSIIGARVTAVLPGERGALATALLTGERGGISEATTVAYRDSGLIHVLSISGMHMAIMAGTVFAFVRALLALFPPLALNIPTKKWAAVAGALAAILYLGISGGTPATVRSCLMMQVFFLAVLLGRPALSMRNVAISALVILALFPESLLDAGFQMSFGAVVALISAYEVASARRARAGRPSPTFAGRAAVFFAGIVFSTIVASAAVAPLSIYHFHASQQYALLANVAALPVFNIAVMPAALASLLLMPLHLEAVPLLIMGAGLDFMGHVTEWVASLPGAVTRISAISNVGFSLVLFGALWLSLWQRRWRLIGVPIIAAGIAVAPIVERPDVLVGREGALVAVRQADGRLGVLASRPSTFELSRWLEQDGDERTPREARRSSPFRCDGTGCTARVRGMVVAVLRHPSGGAEDCRRADILIIDGYAPRHCPRPRAVIDRDALLRSGTHTIHISGTGDLRVTSVGQQRGTRPWGRLEVERSPSRHAASEGTPGRSVKGRGTYTETGSNRLMLFSPPEGMLDPRAWTAAAYGPDDEEWLAADDGM